MLNLIRAHCFYATRAAFGRHEFAHLKHSAATSTGAWAFTLSAISLWSLMSFAFDPSFVILALMAVSGLLASSTIGLRGPHQIGILYSVGGVFLWNAPILYALSGHWLLYATQATWIAIAVSQNTHRFQLLPADMKADGYAPGRE